MHDMCNIQGCVHAISISIDISLYLYLYAHVWKDKKTDMYICVHMRDACKVVVVCVCGDGCVCARAHVRIHTM